LGQEQDRAAGANDGGIISRVIIFTKQKKKPGATGPPAGQKEFETMNCLNQQNLFCNHNPLVENGSWPSTFLQEPRNHRHSGPDEGPNTFTSIGVAAQAVLERLARHLDSLQDGGAS
jgi:hypothetical protein